MQRACIFGTSLLLLLLAPSAQAADKESQERAARKACLSGDYAKGVEILSDLFLDTKNPTYIFNQARCYEQNNHCSEAVGRFREYLRKAPGMKFSERTEVEKHIEECEAVLASKQSPVAPAPASVTPPPATPEPPAPAPPVAATAVTPVDVSAPPPASEQVTATPASKSYGLVIAGVCAGVAGLAGIGVGFYYFDRAKYYSNKASQPGASPSVDDDGRHAENMQWIFFGLGGATLATGAVLAILGWPSSEPSTPSTSFAPMLGPGLAGLAARGSF
jgi:hypothetical protein